MVDHKKVAQRIIKKIRLTPIDPSFELYCKGMKLRIDWDGAGKDNNKVVLFEVEPSNPSENHIRLHILNLAITAFFRKEIKKLVWIVYSDAPRCEKNLKYYTNRWRGFLEKVLKLKLPPMKYCNRKGQFL